MSRSRSTGGCDGNSSLILALRAATVVVEGVSGNLRPPGASGDGDRIFKSIFRTGFSSTVAVGWAMLVSG